VLEAHADLMRQAPLAFGHLLGCAATDVDGGVRVVLDGAPGKADFEALVRATAAVYVPALSLAGADTDMALTAGKAPRDGGATAYVCRGFTCDAPTKDAAELTQQLRDAAGS
jgi:uncharacterized protein YyaL (SSP411 family)